MRSSLLVDSLRFGVNNSATMNEKIIFVFPGQGSQYVGMGADVFQDFAAARHVYQEVSDAARRDVAKISFSGTAAELNKPDNTSLCTFAHSVAIARVIEDEYKMPVYNIAYAIAGHSMGQYSALHCAGSLSLQDAVDILAARSSYMSLISAKGGMVAVVGLEYDVVKAALRATIGCGYAEISNHNARDQFIVSGENAALDAFIEKAKEYGARLVRKLNVSIPAHCALMSGAEEKLRKTLSGINIDAPKTNWFSNQTANTMSNPMDVRDALADQMTNGVRWYEIMQQFPRYKITSAYELGPGRTLSGLINRSDVGCAAMPTDKSMNVKQMLHCLEYQIAKQH